MADVLLLQYLHSQNASLEKCQFHHHVTAWTCQSWEWQIWCHQQCFSNLQLGRNVWMYLCHTEKQQLLIESLRHIQVHHHMEQTVSSQIEQN